jgi:hypothetical protein
METLFTHTWKLYSHTHGNFIYTHMETLFTHTADRGIDVGRMLLVIVDKNIGNNTIITTRWNYVDKQS